MKEIIRELKIQREVDFHDNIIRCYGITKIGSENSLSTDSSIQLTHSFVSCILILLNVLNNVNSEV
uniref:Uncharacterized protein n=1 Tax=Rhizophagus irregularis (strain DAOM 181602 / DAOM 197198 / MUCL 43194) TaxID=747089 RepID=U9U6P4_RHIID